MITKALFLFFLCFYSLPSFANDVLKFKKPTSHKEKIVTTFLNKNKEGEKYSYLLAKIDLNNDFIDEYVVKPSAQKHCNPSHYCPHYIIALPKYQPVLIGTFHTQKIIIEHATTYGVRHLKVYNNPNNNFSYSTARWNPFSSQYEAK